MAKGGLRQKAYVIPIDAAAKTMLIAVKAEYNGTLLCAHGHPAISAAQQFLHGQPNAFGGNLFERRKLRSAQATCIAELREESGDRLQANANFSLPASISHTEITTWDKMEFYVVAQSMIDGTPGVNPFYHTSGNVNRVHDGFGYQECARTVQADLSTLAKGASDQDIADVLFDAVGLGAGHAEIPNWLATGTGKAMVGAVRTQLAL